jgi:dTMP kinase
MRQPKGAFIVLEGSDGSGKTTQFNLLKERLKAIGYDVAVFDFPRYSHESSYLVRQYLAGGYGPATTVSPYTASLFYAMDRYDAAKDIKKALKQGKIVLANRYAGSNMAHQGAKFKDPVEQRGFFVWEDNLEFQLLNIPRPDVSFFLRVPAEISRRLIKERAAKNGEALDGHEKDSKFLKKSLMTFDILCELFPKDFKAIECTKDGRLLGVAQISNLLWEEIKPLLPSEKPHASHSVVVTLNSDTRNNDDIGDRQTAELNQKITNSSLLLRLEFQRNSNINVSPNFISWAHNGYRFYTPQGLPKDIENRYKQSMSRFVAIQGELSQKLNQYLTNHLFDGEKPSLSSIQNLLLPLTPLCAICSYKITLKKEQVVPLTSQLLANDADEVQWTAKQIYLAARQKWPDDFSAPLESSDGPELVNSIIAKLAEERLPKDHSADNNITLLEAHPRLEFDLLAESIYPYTSLSLEEITEEVANWPYSQKYESLKQAADQPELLKKVRYKMDIISDQIVLDDIFKAAGLKDLQSQVFTPRYGFDVPPIIEEAMADDLYNECFDESLKLYSLMQGAGREDLAPYATLLGHKLRWQLNVDALDVKEIIKQAGGSHRSVVNDLLEKVSEIHPLLWEVIAGRMSPAGEQHRNGKSRVKPFKQVSVSKNARKKRS